VSEHHTEKDGISTHLNSAGVISKMREFVIMKKMTIVTVLHEGKATCFLSH